MDSKSFFRPFLLFFLFQLLLGGCVRRNPIAENGASSGAHRGVVNLAVWSNYIPQEVIQNFERQSGIKVRVSHYSSNEELLAKIQTGSSEYDLVVPSDYMVFVMIKLGLLHALDYSQLASSKFIDAKFLKKAYDPENKYSVPYDWGTTGIAINHALYPGEVRSWKDLLEKTDLAGKISLLDDARELIGAALKSLGYSMNSTRMTELLQAKQLLLKNKARVKTFTSEPLMALLNGEVAVSQIYMSDALQVRKLRGDQIEYVVPAEGGTLWIDNLVIPAHAQHVKEAHQFLSFLLEPQSNAETVKSVWVAPANREVFKLLPEAYQKNHLLFPASSVLARCEMIQDLGSFISEWDRIWTEFKAL
jgi:spermidine/putrescine transport system substrate-binding protein